MTYRILSTRNVEETLFTTVEYTFENDIVTVEVAHFAPSTKQDVITGIENRAVSEENKLNAAKLVQSIKLDIDNEL